jgi:hypothetical protein
LLYVLMIAAGVIVGIGVAAVAGLLAWRWRSWKEVNRPSPPRVP